MGKLIEIVLAYQLKWRNSLLPYKMGVAISIPAMQEIIVRK